MNSLSALFTLEPHGAPQMHFCEPQWQWSPPPLRDFDLWIVLDGVGKIGVNGSEHSLCAGVSCLLRPGDRVVAEHDPRRRLRVFACHFDGDAACQSVLKTVERVRRITNLPVLNALADHITTRQNERESSAWPGQAGARLGLLQLLDLHARSTAETVPELEHKLRQIAVEIQRAPGAVESVRALAVRYGISPSHFTRQFKRLHGIPPSEYLLQARVRRACQLLKETRMSIEQIAQAAGFSDRYHFTKQFRRIIGVPPARFREEGD